MPATQTDLARLRDDVNVRQLRTESGRGLWAVEAGDMRPVTRWPEHGEIVMTGRQVYVADTDGGFDPLGPSAVCAAIRLVEELLHP